MVNTQICRTCLSVNRQMLPLETPVPYLERITLLECLRTCTRLDLHNASADEHFKYPMQMCVRCSKALQVAYHFIKLARDSERNLRAQEKVALVHCVKGDCMVAKEQKYISSSSSLLSPACASKIDSNASRNNDVPEPKVADDYNSIDTVMTKSTRDDQNMLERVMFAASVEQVKDLEKAKDSPGDIKAIDRDVLAELSNQNAISLNTNANDACSDADDNNFDEEIKENLIKAATSNAPLVRNRNKVLEDTKELQKALEQREVELNNSNEIVCVLCDKHFSDMQTFIRHRNRHKGITPFRCNTCNFFTCYSESLRKHYKKQHEIVATNEMLQTTIDQHEVPMESPYEEITYKCSLCIYGSHKEQNVKMHMVNEHLLTLNLEEFITKNFNCPDCHRNFGDQKSMRTHFTLTHGTSMGIRKQSTETHICEHCDKKFQFRCSLLAHQRICRQREVVNCTICGKKFITVRKFERHLRTDHNVETIHECEVCGKSFNNTESLTIHRKRHMERHYQCELCPRNYINSSELKVHVKRMHSKEAKAQCLTCGMTFTHRGLLREHDNKMHKRKFFKCLHCEYESTSRCNLRQHEYKHTGKPYKCDVCGREFALRSKIRRHAYNLHSIKLSEEQLGAMFRKKFGYPSRYDAFSKANNSLEIEEVSAEDIELELQECGLKFDDLVKDLFDHTVIDDAGNV